MPSSPKYFNARTSSYNRRSAVLIFCLLIGLVGFLTGIVSILRPALGYKCKNREPRSVSVAWERGGGSENGNGGSSSNGDQKRHKVMGFVGIQTGFGSVGRRRSLRQTWMPSNQQGLQRSEGLYSDFRETLEREFGGAIYVKSLEEATGLAIRFVIGRTRDKSKMSELKKEVAKYDDFMLLDIEEEYSKLPYKTLAFFKAAYAIFDSEFYVKVDDDIYLRPDRLSLLLAKERSHPQTYIGCMKKGPVFTDPHLKWYEPLSYLLGNEYFLHAYGPIYALSADVVSSLDALKNNSFRMFSNEDVTIGAWMLAMNVDHEDNRQICESECTSSSIAVWDIPKCSGLCEPEKKLLELHRKEICSKSPTVASDD